MIFLRRCLKIHPFIYALYQYRIGNTHFSCRLTAHRRPKTGFEKHFCARVEEICDIVERGYGAEIPGSATPVSWNRRVLFVLHYSLPYDPAGYAIRSHSILTHLKRHGLDVLAVTRPGYPWDLGGYVGKGLCAEDIIDGLCYMRLRSNCNCQFLYSEIMERAAAQEADAVVIPRKATNDTSSPAMNINSRVAQACNSQMFRAFAPCS